MSAASNPFTLTSAGVVRRLGFEGWLVSVVLASCSGGSNTDVDLTPPSDCDACAGDVSASDVDASNKTDGGTDAVVAPDGQLGTCDASGWNAGACACRKMDALCVELLWNSGADLDLHLATALDSSGKNDADCDGISDPWFSLPGDCFWYNTDPSQWPPADGTKLHNPHMRSDAQVGPGPEIVTLQQPEPGRGYALGVYVWDAEEVSATTATVTVYSFGSKVVTVANPSLLRGDLWTVASLTWTPAAGLMVNECHQTKPPCAGGIAWLPTGEACKSACYANQKFFDVVGHVACP